MKEKSELNDVTSLISLNYTKTMIVNVCLNIGGVKKSNLFVSKSNRYEYNCSSNFMVELQT